MCDGQERLNSVSRSGQMVVEFLSPTKPVPIQVAPRTNFTIAEDSR